MSDSTKRVLFGNSNTNAVLKINVHATLQFSDKSIDNVKKVENQNHNLSIHKSGNSVDKFTQSPKNASAKFNKNFLNSLNNNNSNLGVNDNKSPKFNIIKRPVTSIHNHKKMRNISASPQQRQINQKSGKKKNNIKDLSSDQKKIFLDEPEEDLKDNSFIDIEVEREDKKDNKDFTEFINVFK